MGSVELGDACNSGGKKFVIEIPEDLEPLLLKPASWRNHCIYKVPKKLRKINEAAYTPRAISIGPLHHDNNALKDMEALKLIHLAKFCLKTGKRWTDFEMRIRGYEQSIRECYELENYETHGDDFAKMILLDSVFIIELLLKGIDPNSYEEDFILGKPWLSSDILLDLVLLENQIPYFVLEDLYDFALPHDHELRRCSFFRLACFLLYGFTHPRELRGQQRGCNQDCFSWCNCFWMVEDFAHRKARDGYEQKKDPQINPQDIPILIKKLEEEHYDQKSEVPKIRHLLDLLRKFRIYSLPKANNFDYAKNLFSATMLHDAGVEFQFNPDAWPLEVEFAYGVLKMPRFEVEDSTECVIRNLMAFEQCHYPKQSYICAYISLLDSLINTAEDVDLLVKRGVLVHFLGDSKAVAGLLNGLDREITHTKSPYLATVLKLNGHCENGWYRTVAIMRRVYFNNPWRGTATIAAIILLCVALIQAASSIKEIFF